MSRSKSSHGLARSDAARTDSSAVSPPFRLDGQTVLITGGATGLGRGIAECCVAAGGRVVIVGRRARALEMTASELGADATSRVFDVNQTDRCDELIADLSEAGWGVGALVHCAGVHSKRTLAETTPESFEMVLKTHLTGGLALARSVTPHMRQHGGGAMLFIASMTSYLAMPKVIAYTTAKTGVVGLVRGLAAEVADDQIRVNAIAPGWIESPMLRQALDGDPSRQRRILERTPLGRFGEPHDIGWAAVYLLSEQARFVSGTILPVDGGAHVGF